MVAVSVAFETQRLLECLFAAMERTPRARLTSSLASPIRWKTSMRSGRAAATCPAARRVQLLDFRRNPHRDAESTVTEISRNASRFLRLFM